MLLAHVEEFWMRPRMLDQSFIARSSRMLTRLAVGVVAAFAVAGCTHERNGPTLGHYDDFQVRKPNGNSVYVCHAYGCKMQTRVRFTDADIEELRKLMKKTAKDKSPAEERRAVAYAIGWMERKVGAEIGTDKDREGMDFAASGDPTQQDCVDEATNTTTYLLTLAHNGLIKQHEVGTPFAKDDYTRGVAGWTHWTAVLQDKTDGKKYAVDSWIYANGENPAIVEADKWYIADLASLPASTR
ncbi:MAG: hypothetical protein AB7E80_01470 [Hyphomicrobiaceae bacterium]